MNTLTIKAGASTYPVFIANGLIDEFPKSLKDMFPKSRFALITDATVGALYGSKAAQAFATQGLSCHVFTVEPGEGAKSMAVMAQLLSGLAQHGFNRADVIVALGGGVVGDLAGFVAAVYLRGIRYVQVPTTLLSQIDSAVGGKTAVNLPEGKNLVGAFHQPAAVFADPATLRTLPDSDFSDGMAELIKYALIRDADMFAQLEEGGTIDAGSAALPDLIARCLGIKRDVVAADERDTGERMLLNFGHTIGHGIERLCAAQKRPMTHGKAVAIGMAAITAASERMGLTQQDTARRVVALLQKTGLPHDISVFDKNELLKGILVDKKTVADTLTLVLIEKPGVSFLHRIHPGDMPSFI